MAAKHILMGFCALYALARGIGTVLYYLSGAGQLQIAVLIISFIVSVIGLVAVVLWIAQRQVKGITVRLLLFLYSGAAVAISSSPGAIRCRRASAPGSFSSPVRYLSACCFWLRCSSPCRITPTRENNFFHKRDCLIHRLDV